MKCPVCDQNNSSMLCPNCGFDASRDYEKYPTFGRIKASPSVSARRMHRQNAPKKTTPKTDGPRYVDYQKMVSQAAQADAAKRAAQVHQLTNELQSAQNTISTLKSQIESLQKRKQSLLQEQKVLTDTYPPENRELKERIAGLVSDKKRYEREMQAIQDRLRHLVDENARLTYEKRHAASQREEAERKLEDVVQQLHSLQKSYDLLSEEKSKLMKDLQEAAEHLAKLKKQADADCREIQQLTDLLASRESLLAKEVEERQSAAKKLREANNRLQGVEAERNEYKEAYLTQAEKNIELVKHQQTSKKKGFFDRLFGP